MEALRVAGFEVVGFDPSPAMVAEAQAAYPALSGRIGHAGLPIPAGRGYFGGILCSAVLMHVPAENWFDAVYSIRESLEPGGRAVISVSSGRATAAEGYRDEKGRLFREPHPEGAQLFFERAGFVALHHERADDNLRRSGVTWHTFVFEKPLDGTSQPLDTIQRIIGSETKSATYKLALLRALAEAATRDFQRIVPVGEGRIGVPLDLIAEKWLRYYWPLFESNRFIPGANGERPGAPKPLAFRRKLTTLVDCYKGAGGYPRFYADWTAGELSPTVTEYFGAAFAKIKGAIREGPVVFAAKGAFGYDKSTGLVSLPFELWREFMHLGAWIEPAVIFEWAQETRRMSKGELAIGEVISLLAAELDQDRSVAEARQTYGTAKGLRCVWTGQELPNAFDVDHAIPFSLWRCNDLWNLLPAHPIVNNRKRDRLPSQDLISRSEERIVGCWRILDEVHPRRFRGELTRFLGWEPPRSNWENRVLGRFREAVESTAILRRVTAAERYEVGK